MRRSIAGWGVWWLVGATRVWADIPPTPEEPGWDETPLPMPEEVFVLVLLAVVAAIVLVARRRRVRAA
ncbi:MAG: hypothetical protein H6722_16050 [Sandaracinus sp.]|nr:hypothetical protein [Sandaracinus sp.]